MTEADGLSPSAGRVGLRGGVLGRSVCHQQGELGASSLVGRADELAMLRQRLQAVARGVRQAVLVEGEAGIGKTRLVEAAAGEALAYGCRVLTASGDELFTDRPAGLMVDAFGLTAEETDPERAAAAEAAGLGGPVRADPVAGRHRAIEAFAALVERLVADAPVVLVVEDVHWADPLSLLVLQALWRRWTHLPIAVVLTFRSPPSGGELAACVAEMERTGGLLVALRPLDSAATRDIAEGELGAPPGPGLCQVLAKAGGNPFFVRELLHRLRADERLTAGPGVVEVGSGTVPLSLTAAVRRRLDGLGEGALHTLRVAAVQGTRFSARDLSLVLERSSAELLETVDELVRAGVLTHDGDALAFRHDVVREAVYLDLPRSLRAALHVDAARRLAAGGASATAVARHYLRGAEPGDADAVEWLQRGAHEQLPHDPAAAAGLLERALELAGPGHPRFAALSASRVLALAWAARLEDAERVAEQALRRIEHGSARADVQLGLARARMIHGRLGDALTAFSEALSASERHARPRLLAERAVAALFRGDVAAARADAADPLVADDQSSAAARGTAAIVLAWEATLRGRLDEGARRARGALALAAGDRDPWTSRVASMTPFCLTRADCLDEALDVARQALASAEEAQRANEAASLQSVLGILEFHAGRWDDAEADLATALMLADEVGVPVIAGAWWPLALRAQIALRRGDLALAERVLAEACAAPEDGARLGLDYVYWTRALLADARGDPGSALEWLHAAWELDRALGLRSELATYAAALVNHALARGESALAHEVTEMTEEVAEQAPQATTEGVALHCRGLVAADPERLVAAVERFGRTRHALRRALTNEDAADQLAGVDTTRAAGFAHEALAAYEALGADRDAARVKALLRRLGVHRGARGTRRRPATGWDSLTPTEVEVARLVVEGLTNREIGARLYISSRTVGTHISNALGKLGLRSRVELAAEVSRRTPQG